LLTLIIGTLVVLHGLVHLLYSGQSWRLFELQPGMVWPENAWTLSRLLGNQALRAFATLACALAAIGFVAGAAGIFLGTIGGVHWWWGRPHFRRLCLRCSRDGRTEHLAEKGAVGMLIDLAILITVVVVPWRQFMYGPG
jgi:hypothetical protein